jgi:uncharacterized BrkB/YihY/UPF0761 family membrane protein
MKKLFSLSLATIAGQLLVKAQKVPSLNDVVKIAETTSQQGWTLANWIITIVMGIGLILLVLAFVTEHPKKREFLIGYVTAIILWGAANLLFK